MPDPLSKEDGSPLPTSLMCVKCGRETETPPDVMCHRCLKAEIQRQRDRILYGVSFEGPNGERIDPNNVSPA